MAEFNSKRLENIELWPDREAPGEARGQQVDEAQKSKKSLRRKGKREAAQWRVMQRLNDSTSLPVVESVCQMPSIAASRAHYATRSESESPLRPRPPPTSPRKQKHTAGHNDSEEHEEEEEDTRARSTKMSL